MPAAVMPQQMGLGHIQRKAIIQDALQVLCFQIILIYCIGGKEGGRRHLLGVTYDNRVFPSGQNTHGLTGGQLRCFVKNHNIKGLPLGI